jgi:hypothetical protein
MNIEINNYCNDEVMSLNIPNLEMSPKLEESFNKLAAETDYIFERDFDLVVFTQKYDSKKYPTLLHGEYKLLVEGIINILL